MKLVPGKLYRLQEDKTLFTSPITDENTMHFNYNEGDILLFIKVVRRDRKRVRRGNMESYAAQFLTPDSKVLESRVLAEQFAEKFLVETI